MYRARRKKKRDENGERYTKADFLADILFLLPELLFLPIRLLWMGIKAVLRAVSNFN